MASATLLDIAKLNGNDKVVGLIEENLTYAPELNYFPARTISGTTYNTVVRTAYPGVGFRYANEGVTVTKSSFDKRQVQCFILSAAIQVDKAVGMAYEDGLAAWEMIEASGTFKQVLIDVGSQIWYGTSADSKGFSGLKAAVPYSTAATALCVNAGGSASVTASSFYAVKFGVQSVQFLVGQGGAMTLSEFRDQQLTDANSGVYAGRVADMTTWVGLQVGNSNCVGRIANLTEDSGKGLTDSLIANLLSRFPVGYTPDLFFGSRRSLRQLQQSRTVTINSNGPSKATSNVENVAPWPTSAFDIPIVTTDSILNTDAIES